MALLLFFFLPGHLEIRLSAPKGIPALAAAELAVDPQGDELLTRSTGASLAVFIQANHLRATCYFHAMTIHAKSWSFQVMP